MGLKIICEVGVNWSTMEEAFKFIEKSKELGLWATKFQIYSDEQIKDNPNREFLKSIMIGEQEAMELLDYGDLIGQTVFFSVMYPSAIDWLEELGVEYYKIRYVDRNNARLLEKIASTRKPTFLSCDLQYLNWNSISDESDVPIFLYCSPRYPSKLSDYPFSIRYGYFNFKGISDHLGSTDLLKICLEHNRYEYHECHVMLDGTEPLEKNWSINFSQLREVLNK